MLFRDLGVTYRQATATRRIDQRPRLVPGRILESGTSRAAPQRLRILAGTRDRIHLRADGSRVAGCAAEDRFDYYRACGHAAVPIDRKSTRLNSSHPSISYA